MRSILLTQEFERFGLFSVVCGCVYVCARERGHDALWVKMLRLTRSVREQGARPFMFIVDGIILAKLLFLGDCH
jgi:hypothetical protein